MESVLLTASSAIAPVTGKYPGIRLHNYVLSTGAALAPLLQHISTTNEQTVLRKLQEFRFEVMSKSETNPQTFIIQEIRCASVFIADFVHNTVERDLAEIQFNPSNTQTSLEKKLFAVFLLFSIGNENVNTGQALNLYFNNLLPISRKLVGSSVTVLSTPFHNLSLFNAHSKGIISNVFGRNNCIFLIDVKLSSGCEGAPVFSIFGELIGVVVAVFTWCKGEWMGFSMAIHLHSVLKSWLRKCTDLPVQVRQCKTPVPPIGDSEVDSFGVVLVSGPRVWGSGVLLNKDQGLIITCSHVVSFSTTNDIFVEHKRKKYTAKVLYATPMNSPFDVAIIKTTSSSNFNHLSEFKPPVQPIEKGDAVYIIGYPLFSFKNHTVHGPSVTFGHVSNVFGNALIMVSCVSNSGSSGGALVRPNGELLGIVSNNLKLGANDLLVPHLTVAVPSAVFLETVRRFSVSNDLNVLNCLKTNEEVVKRIWELDAPQVFVKSKL